MRRHDPPDRDAPTRSAAQPRTGGGSAPPTSSPDAILALQQQAGNAAVTRAVQRLHAESDPEQGHSHHDHGGELRHGPEPVQRSTVPEVLRSAGQPLDESTRTDMEARLGADFSDVRLHTGTLAERSAAEVGARAYTSGNHVVIGQGGADRHTLAHELTHVIQQRTGPVAGTDDGHGLSVSDPGDRFERAAETNAHRALGSRPARPEAHTAPEPAGPPPPGIPAVQGVWLMSRPDLHREPAGPSVQVSGPGQPGTTHQVDQQTWNVLSAGYQASTGRTLPAGQPFSLDNDLATVIETSRDPAFGQGIGHSLGGVAERAGIPRTVGTHRRANAEMMEELGRLDPASRPYWQTQDRRDEQLAHDVVSRAAGYQQDGSAQDAAALRDEALTQYYTETPADATDLPMLGKDGLVIGGSHQGEAFFPWATNNMAKLHAQGIRTLYLEAFREDVHQRLVDDYLRSGTMSPELANFCNAYQAKWDLVPFLAAARATGMRIKGIAGRPARRGGASNEEQQHRRAAMMNTYGEQVIRWDRGMLAGGGNPPADPGKYLVQVGAAHAGTHTNAAPNPVNVAGVTLPDQFPGINELLGVSAVRIEEGAGGTSFPPI